MFILAMIQSRLLLTEMVHEDVFFLFSCSKIKPLFLCVRMFVVQQIPDSNLLMLVVQADCDCSRQYPPITMDPKEVKYILSHYIILDTTMYRIEYPLFIMIQDCKMWFRGQVEGWSQPPCWPLKTEDNLFWTSQRASFFPVLFFLDSVTHNASVKCDRMRSQKIRRRPESCHAYHPQVSLSFAD